MNPATVNYLSVFKEVVEIIFYVVTGTVVVLGLKSWRKELKGRTSYDAAKDVITGAYRVRDAINNARSIMMFPAEWADREKSPNESGRDTSAKDSLYAYARRYEKVANAITQWYPAVVEAEALLGEVARMRIESLNFSALRLKAAIECYHYEEIHGLATDSRAHKQSFNIIYGLHPSSIGGENPKSDFDDDGFQEQLDSAVREIKEYFSVFIK